MIFYVIFALKHILLVLTGIASLRQFHWVPIFFFKNNETHLLIIPFNWINCVNDSYFIHIWSFWESDSYFIHISMTLLFLSGATEWEICTLWISAHVIIMQKNKTKKQEHRTRYLAVQQKYANITDSLYADSESSRYKKMTYFSFVFFRRI